MIYFRYTLWPFDLSTLPDGDFNIQTLSQREAVQFITNAYRDEGFYLDSRPAEAGEDSETDLDALSRILEHSVRVVDDEGKTPYRKGDACLLVQPRIRSTPRIIPHRYTDAQLKANLFTYRLITVT